MRRQIKIFVLYSLTAVWVFMAGLSPVLAVANTASGTALPKQSNAQQNRLETLREKALAEITRRINMLEKLALRLSDAKKLSETDRQALTAIVGTDIDSLNRLKTKIESDSTLAALKADTQAIVKDYRVYVLVVPKVQLIAASDRLDENADKLATVSGKLQVRISEAQGAGKDVSALQTLYNDMVSKINDARNQAKLIHDKIITLTPQGYPANKADLKSAREMLKTGRDDLKTAHQDATAIVKRLRAFQ